MQAASDLESRLSRLFATMDARQADIRREREDRKLSRRRYWWQDEPKTECQMKANHKYMNTKRSITAKELKSLTKMKRLAQALNVIYARLEKRTWRVGGYLADIAGINWEQDFVLFSHITNSGENSVAFRYWRTPISEAIDCLSGDLQPNQVERRA